jgi:hypothetical protein
MAKDKKSPKETEKQFMGMLKAMVKGNPKPKAKAKKKGKVKKS